MVRFLALLIVSAALLAPQASAHHSISAMFQEKEVVRIEGQLAQLNFRNPHSIMHVIVKDKGREVRYAVEWAAAGELEVQGITSHTLKIGDHLVITGSPARNPDDHRVRMTTLHRPKDDFNYYGLR
jgi:hypothetical protein